MTEPMSSAETLVELRGIRKTYHNTIAVDDISLRINRGEFVVLLGPSGSGKTTILSILGGFTEPTAGSVYIDGVDVTAIAPAKRPTVTVFQDYALFPHMSVADNVGFGLVMRKVARSELAQRVVESLALVGLDGFGGRAIHELSGGQRQRVALARAIAVKPTVLLLDEPLGALDLNLRRQMQEELVGLQKQLGTTFVHVTHDQEEAMSIADRLVVMNAGGIEDVGPPDRVYLRPATVFTATFMGESNILPAKVTGRSQGGMKLSTSIAGFEVPGDTEHDDVHVSLRPEHLKVDASDNCTPLGQAVITEMLFQGAHRRCRATSVGSNEPLLLRLPVEKAVEIGQTFDLYVRRDDIVVLAD